MKKYKGFIILLLMSLSLFGLTACQSKGEKVLTYKQITAGQALAEMGYKAF